MRATCLVTIVLLGGWVTGCAETQPEKGEDDLQMRQAEWSEQQEKTLRDPMGYRPDMDRSDVSGGGMKDFDREGFKKDMKAWTLD